MKKNLTLGAMLSLSVFAIVLWLPLMVSASNTITYPEPKYVSDYANVLTAEEVQSLTDRVLTFKQETSNEIAILIVPTTEPETIEEYGIHVADKWKIGKKDKDNGVLFTIAVEDHKMRLDIGRGLEGAIPDISTVKILNTYARPEFKQDNYYKGINDSLDVIEGAAKGEFNVADLSGSSSESRETDKNISFFIYFAVIIFSLFIKYMASTKSWWLGGVVGAVAAFSISLLVSAGIIGALIFAVIFGAFGLLLDYIISGNAGGKGGSGRNSGGSSGGGWWWGGGSSSGSGSDWSSGGDSSFGGGGFSGGGGSSSW